MAQELLICGCGTAAFETWKLDLGDIQYYPILLEILRIRYRS